MTMWRFILLCCFSLFLTACFDSTPEVKGDSDSPEYVATVYFYTLYEEKDLNKASKMATPKLRRVMKSYGTSKQFTRGLVNMQFDTVNIEVDRTGRSVRKRYKDKATINLIFSGYFNDKKVDDMRSVVMINRKGTWFVEKINDDPYAR